MTCFVHERQTKRVRRTERKKRGNINPSAHQESSFERDDRSSLTQSDFDGSNKDKRRRGNHDKHTDQRPEVRMKEQKSVVCDCKGITIHSKLFKGHKHTQGINTRLHSCCDAVKDFCRVSQYLLCMME